ncbi:MAG TPA: prolyl oligopeptidase family serine peptidase [Candidatus Eisenbacteria bacterium]
MNRRPHRALAVACSLIALAPLARTAPAAARATTVVAGRYTYPGSRVAVVRDTLHGTVIEDPYRWLETRNSPETRDWLDRQIAFTAATLADLPGRATIRTRLEQLLKVDAQTPPTERGGRYFFTKRGTDQDQRVLVMRRGATGRDEVLLDPGPLSPDHTTSASYLDVSTDGRMVAIGTRLGGKDEVTVSFMDPDTRQTLTDRLPEARYFAIAITPDQRGCYYSKYTKEGSRVYFHAFHALGGPAAEDRLVFGEGRGPEQIIDVTLSEDGRWLLFTVYHGSSGDQTELWVQDVAARGPITPVVSDLKAFFSGQIAGNWLYMRTNWNASNGRILRADLTNPARDAWKEIVPAGSSAIEDFAVAGHKVFVNVLENVVSKIHVYDADGKPLGEIALPTLGTAGALVGRWSSTEAFYPFDSFVVPPSIYRYNTGSRENRPWWQASVPIQSRDFQVKQVTYRSKDGTPIPMFMVSKRGTQVGGSHPVYLTGYGGFTVNITPHFSPLCAVWVENGGIYAVPNLRGGSEFGEAWHKAGMLDKKQNVFDDFIAAAEYLITSGTTTPKRLAIEGGSNGGLLVGAAFTQRPELYQAVICAVPLLDMLRYQNFLVARFWVPEYGSSEDPDQFKYLYAYSPYHHVRKGVDYPAVMFISGDSDTRVDPLHARKMTALLQASTGGDRPILLHYDTKAGHAGGKPVSKQIEDDTDELLFLFWQLGIKPAAPVGVAAGGARR